MLQKQLWKAFLRKPGLKLLLPAMLKRQVASQCVAFSSKPGHRKQSAKLTSMFK